MGFLNRVLSSFAASKSSSKSVQPVAAVQVSMEGTGRRFASADEYRKYLNDVRRDPAAQAWRRNPGAYNAIPRLSFVPTCPYCGGSLGDRKRPTRRSQFTCKLCSNKVYVDAWHRIFPKCYLNAKQGLIARFLGELANMAGAAGTSEDFWWFAQQKDWTRGKCPLSDQEAGDVLWGLMNYSVVEMQNILPREELNAFAGHARLLQELLARYREEEKQLKDVHQKVKAIETSEVELICPNCHGSLGLVKQPTRRSSRNCKLCKKVIGVDPKQKLYKGAFLTERQVFLVGILAALDHRVTTRGSLQDFNRVKRSLGLEGSLDDRDIAKVLRALALENIKLTRKGADKEHAEYVRVLGRHAGPPDYREVEYVTEILTELDSNIANWD